MKKIYNKLTTTDVPLDASFDVSSRVSNKMKGATTSKPTIKAIGSKAKSSSSAKNSNKTSTSKSSSTTSSKQLSSTNSKNGEIRKILTKDSLDIQELEKLNEDSIKSYSFRSKRNQAIIILLSVLLALAITFIVIFAVANKTENNCFLKVEGEAEAVYIVNDKELSEFRTPSNLIGDCILELDIDLNIKTEGEFNVKFNIVCYYDDKILPSVVVYEPNTTDDGFTYGLDGFYHSKKPIKGNSTINLCKGVAMNEFDLKVDIENFRLEVYTYIERA